MKILMVIGQFHPIMGGAERQCLKLSRELQKLGREVKVLTVWNPRTVSQNEKVAGVPVERVWYPIINAFGYRVGLGFLAPLFFWRRVYQLAHECDVVHVHQCLWPAFVAVLAARARGKPIVCKLGNSGERFDLDVLRRTHVYGRIAAWYVKRHITKFIWTSKAVRDDLMRERIAEKKRVYIPNGVELPTHPLNHDQQYSPLQFIFTGTFTVKKNLLILLNAMHDLSPSYRDKMKLILLGDGPDRDTLTSAVKQYKLNDIVEIQGPVDDVGPYLEKSDVFILPSSTEGLSNSALEAMAYGLPVILSNRGGNRDLVEGNGILVDPDHVESLRDALQYMIDHPEERREMGARSRQIVEERYAMAKVVRKYEGLYQSLKHESIKSLKH